MIRIGNRGFQFIGLESAVEALARSLKNLVSLESEEVSLLEATGRILYEDVHATRDRPRENISAVDGYAVKHVDVLGASLYNPVELKLAGSLRPGSKPNEVHVKPGTAARVQTGAPIPHGADAVVMDEDAEVRGDVVVVYKQVAKGENVIYSGEDLKRGELIASKGTIAGPGIVAALAASGVSRVRVYRKIRVSVIAVGDELVEPGSDAAQDKEFNATAYLVYSQLTRDRIYEPRYYGIVPDDAKLLEEAIFQEIERGADVVITTGGTGVSESDVISELAAKHVVVFRGVKMRPGRPTSCTVIGGKPVLHLSGFPVASWVGYEMLLRRATILWLLLKGFERPQIEATLARRLPNPAGYTSVIRVSVEAKNGEYRAEPYMLRGSGVISSLFKTNGYIVVPENVEGFEKGSRVRVYLHAYW